MSSGNGDEAGASQDGSSKRKSAVICEYGGSGGVAGGYLVADGASGGDSGWWQKMVMEEVFNSNRDVRDKGVHEFECLGKEHNFSHLFCKMINLLLQDASCLHLTLSCKVSKSGMIE